MQEQDDAAEHAGPLAEIEFWRSRTVDLGGIRDQLDDKSMSFCIPLQAAESTALYTACGRARGLSSSVRAYIEQAQCCLSCICSQASAV